MNYEHLKVFYTVGKYMSFSKAAAELYTSQPAISRIIIGIENELSCKLFNRTKSGVNFTREGKELFELIKSPFNELNRISDDLTHVDEVFTGTIHIGATVTALNCYFFNMIDIFKKKFPNIHYKIYTGSSLKMLGMLENGEVDLAFITTPFECSDKFKITKLYKINNILVGGQNYKDKYPNPIPISELVNEPFILLSEDMQFRTHIDNFLRKNKVKITPRYEADSSSIIMPMVEHNWGLAFMPEDMANDSIDKKLVYKIDLKESIPYRYVTLVSDSSKQYSTIIYQIQDFIINNTKN